jgi:phosphate transport system permease protein
MSMNAIIPLPRVSPSTRSARRDARADFAFRSVLGRRAVRAGGAGRRGAVDAWGGREAFATFGPGFFTSRLGRGRAQVRRAGADLRHRGHGGIAMLIAVPVSFGIAVFLTEVRRRGCAPVGTARSNCWPASRPSSTACGACSCSRR